MNARNVVFCFICLMLIQNSADVNAAGITPVQLKCEYLVNPLGIDVIQPRFSCVLESGNRREIQTAYQILVASSEEKLQADQGDKWDSGKISSDETVNIEYTGKPLVSAEKCFWKVRSWDKLGTSGPFSTVAAFEMGLLNPSDWRGKWIAGDTLISSPLFRKEFSINKKINRARAYVSGLGYYELYLNGKKVGDRVLDPGWTEYRKRIFYSTYDITNYLKDGNNALGVILGNGWYNPLPLLMWGRVNLREHLTVGKPRVILQLNVEYADGTTASIVTDDSWKVSSGPIVKNNIYLGEIYDATREQRGWNFVGFNDSTWQKAEVVNGPAGLLKAQMIQPIKNTKMLKPVNLSQPKPGVFIFDMGQNFAGWAKLRVEGPRGTKVVLRYGELLSKDGTLNVMTSVAGQLKRKGMGGPFAPDTAYQSDTYIVKGDGIEEWQPRFTFHGFRYVEVTGFPGTPTLQSIEGARLNSSVDKVGSFECSNPMLNRIQDMVVWTQLSNMFSVQSDCPHRERFGYGGDLVATNEMAIYNLDMSQFYTKTVWDFADAVDTTTWGITELAPFMGIADQGGKDGRSGPPGWGSVYVVLPWNLYLYYDDKQILKDHYEGMKRWVSFLGSMADNYIISNGIGDHESVVPKIVPFTSTGFYYLNAHLLSQIAQILGRKEDAKLYTDLAETIKIAFNNKFYKPGAGKYEPVTQCCQTFALMLDLVPQKDRQAALDVLIDDIMVKNKGHISTGIFGTKYLLPLLSDLGRTDVAYTIANQKTFPGWGYMIEHDATTIWEHWEFSDNTFSHNHPMFGSVSEWFYKALAGIKVDPTAPGFKKIIIKPHVAGDLTYVKGSLKTVRGLIAVEWKKGNGSLDMNVTIPANTIAWVSVPKIGLDNVTVSESGSIIWKNRVFTKEGEVITDGLEESEYITFNVGSGSYSFHVGQ